jgi:hypothetical protein
MIGDFVNAFKAGANPGPTPPGFWREAERYGRFEGTGEVIAEVELPEGPLAISAEEYLMVQELQFELTGPNGDAIAVNRRAESAYDDSTALKNLRRIATTKVTDPGLHRIRVKAPNSEEPLLITVGGG